jgi:hypothetical protein
MKILVKNEEDAVDVSRKIQQVANALKATRLDSMEIQSMEYFLYNLRDAVEIEGDTV